MACGTRKIMSVTPEEDILNPNYHKRIIKVDFIGDFGGGR